MQRTKDVHNLTVIDQTTFDAPELTHLGDAAEVIMGMPGGGFDGAYGMTEPPFEFEVDDLDS